MNDSNQKPQATGVYTVADAPLSWRHIGIVASASLGQLIGTGLATLVSVIIPLIQILGNPHLSSVMQGYSASHFPCTEQGVDSRQTGSIQSTC